MSAVTNQKIHRSATPQDLAMQFLKNCTLFPMFHFIGEGAGYLEIIDNLLASLKASSGMIHDAKIAAIYLHHGVSELWTADRDFSRFPKRKTRNPLVKK